MNRKSWRVNRKAFWAVLLVLIILGVFQVEPFGLADHGLPERQAQRPGL